MFITAATSAINAPSSAPRATFLTVGFFVIARSKVAALFMVILQLETDTQPEFLKVQMSVRQRGLRQFWRSGVVPYQNGTRTAPTISPRPASHDRDSRHFGTPSSRSKLNSVGTLLREPHPPPPAPARGRGGRWGETPAGPASPRHVFGFAPILLPPVAGGARRRRAAPPRDQSDNSSDYRPPYTGATRWKKR